MGDNTGIPTASQPELAINTPLLSGSNNPDFSASDRLALAKFNPAAPPATVQGTLDAALAPVCDLLDSMRGLLTDAIKFITIKVNHIKRIAAIMENIGFTIPLPDLSLLPNILTLDIRIYAALQAACPELKLPAYSNQSLEKLRSQVLAAYALIARTLQIHPWSMIKGLEETYNALIGEVDKVLASINIGTGIFRCIQNICDGTATDQVKAVFEGIELPQDYVKTYGSLFTAQQQALTSQTDMLYREIQQLSGYAPE